MATWSVDVRIALGTLFVLAVVGLVLSVICHLAALFGLVQPFGPAVWILHFGLFIVWLPAVVVSIWLVKGYKKKDFWRAVLRGCPTWMRWLTYVLFAYAGVNFFLVVQGGVGRQGNALDDVLLRVFSGHWMLFYFVAAEILYSGIVVARGEPARRCPNGHPALPLAVDCPECGLALVDMHDQH